MKQNKLATLFVLAFAVQAQAFDYQVTCAGKKLTRFENISVVQNSDECKAFIASGYDSCFNSKKPNQSSELITLSTPNDHYYKSKESTRYVRKTVKNIIDSAIKGGNDPYLALAIVLTENPPVASHKKVVDDQTAAESYAESFGTVPLDGIAVADTMACDREREGYANGMNSVKNRSPRLRKFTEDPKGKDLTVCMENKFATGESAQFFLTEKARPDDCCMVLKTQMSKFVHEALRDEPNAVYSYPGPELRARILDILAQKYMTARFNSAQERGAGLKLPEEKMALTAQSFNGYGKFGVSEPMSNQCLHKIHMGTKPVYGAGTSEIMMNSLMNNSEIQDMVSESLKANKIAHADSYLCASYGAGTHTVSGYAFTDLLGGYLNDRKACPRYTNKLKNLSKFAKPTAVEQINEAISPSNDADTKKSNPAGYTN